MTRGHQALDETLSSPGQGGQEAAESALPGMLTERLVAFDLLYSVKLELLQDGSSLALCSHPEVRDLFRRLALDHEAMYEEILALIRRRGWRREPEANRWTASQLVHHVEQTSHISAGQNDAVTDRSKRP